MDKEKINEMYYTNAAAIYKYLCSLTHDPQLAEELTQETFFQAIKGFEKFRGDCKISVWLCRIAKNLWYKELEKRSRHKTIEQYETMHSGDNVEFSCLNNLEKKEV